MNLNTKIVLGVSGSIAAYKSADLVRRLREENYHVNVVMTKEAERFISPLTLATLSGNSVVSEMFDGGDGWQMPHISLAQQAQLFVIAPATANIIAKVAHGFADDVLTCSLLATRAKILFAPAMNTEMFLNVLVQQNITKLKSMGITIVEPVVGKLACGVTGEGHFADVGDIVEAIKVALRSAVA